MNLKNIAQNLGDELREARGNLDIPLTNVTDDSRKVTPGTLFCAIKGEHRDGHDLVPQAIQRGAVAIMAAHEVRLPIDIPLILVNHDRRATAIAAECAAGQPAQHFKTYAVTGTNGKTTSAFILQQVLKAAGRKTAMIGTVQYDLGNGENIPADRTTPPPFALQNYLKQVYINNADACVMELSSHALDQQRIGNLKVDGAIFTNLTQDHLDYHVSLENYYQAKKRLFTKHLKPGAPAVINVDDPYGKRLADELTCNPAGVKVISFSVKNLCTPVCVYVKDLKLSANGMECALSYPDGDWYVTAPLTGLYNGYNIAGVAILAHALGLPNPTVTQALATCLPAPGRLQKISDPNQNIHAFVDYAHTPDALVNVLTALKNSTTDHGKLIAVFGCGGDRDRTKRPKMAQAVENLADTIIVTSDNPRTEDPMAIIQDIMPGFQNPEAVHVQPDRKEAIRLALSLAKPGDTLLVAGKGHEDYQEINGVKHHFSDAEVLGQLLDR